EARGQHYTPDAQLTEGVPGGAVAEQPEDDGGLQDEDEGVAADASFARLLHPQGLALDQIQHTHAPGEVAGQELAHGVGDQGQAVDSGEEVRAAAGEVALGQQQPGQDAAGANDHERFQTIVGQLAHDDGYGSHRNQ